MLAVNLFHMRGGRVLDRREFFWEELPELEPIADGATGVLAGQTEQCARGDEIEGQDRALTGEAARSIGFNPGEFLSALLKQVYIGQPYVPRNIYVPVEFEDRESLEDLLSEQVAGMSARATRANSPGCIFWFRSAARSDRS